MFNKFSSIQNAQEFCQLLSTCDVCPGNSDFSDLVNMKKGPGGQIPVRITPNDKYIVFNSSGTIRHAKCTIIIPRDCKRCPPCTVHRSDLASHRSKMKVKMNTPHDLSSTTPNSYLSHSKLHIKMTKLQADRRRLKRRSGYLELKIEEIYRNEIAILSHQQLASLDKSLEDCAEQMNSVLPVGSNRNLIFNRESR